MASLSWPNTCGARPGLAGQKRQQCGRPVSRIYYSVFGRIFRYARENLSFEPQSSAADHAGLRRHLQRNQKRQLANSLFHLQQWREQCDYRDSVENLSLILAESIQTAEKTFYILGNS
jgi:hypothetical protein